MNSEPRYAGDYAPRQVAAARRVLLDVGQVLQSFESAMVVIGGWVPELLAPDGAPAHVGSIDVDLALDVRKLQEGKYAELLKLLIETGRYTMGTKSFQLVTTVDLRDGEVPVEVQLEFLASVDVKLTKHRPKLVTGFRVLQFSACAVAFEHPQEVQLEGVMISGARNTVRVRVASLQDFLIMKVHAIKGRDKPKDVYDLCYCLNEYPNAIAIVAADWRSRRRHRLVVEAINVLHDKFRGVDYHGPEQFAAFYDSTDPAERSIQKRRAFELVQRLLSLL
jgi:hypothetical protein